MSKILLASLHLVSTLFLCINLYSTIKQCKLLKDQNDKLWLVINMAVRRNNGEDIE